MYSNALAVVIHVAEGNGTPQGGLRTDRHLPKTHMWKQGRSTWLSTEDGFGLGFGPLFQEHRN